MNRCMQRLSHRSWTLKSHHFSPSTTQSGPIRALQVRYSHSLDARQENVPHRYLALKEAKTELYPRFQPGQSVISCSEFVARYHEWVGAKASQSSDICTIHGRLRKIRSAGGKLVFIDIIADNVKVQGVCNQRILDGLSKDEFKHHIQQLQRGDIITLTGSFYETSSGEPSIILKALPELLSPCLHPLPTDLHDPEAIVSKRHVGFLANERAANFIRAKSKIIQGVRQFLLDDEHLEVQTPILADAAGGAIARPFRTKATEFLDRELALRIAPELWLKRMVVGGFDRVFEIGPSFRNEGIDLTHNPEFITCEFYRAYTDLEMLMSMTERMFDKVYRSIGALALPGLDQTLEQKFSGPYERIDFISGIEQAISTQLPQLSSSTALADLKALVVKLSLPIQITESTNLPQLLDKLSGEYLEPFCKNPTFITGHPECMSPLAKSYNHPTRMSQRIAARAELFVQGQELANMYEEENSPVEQRQKFIDQLAPRPDNTGEVDESYLEALEWGLPPVGGWGCGIERLTMAITGASRIGDILSFGTLRNVVSKHNKK